MRTYEIKLASGKVVTWQGRDGVDACKSAADCLRETVVAWREPRAAIHVGIPEGS